MGYVCLKKVVVATPQLREIIRRVKEELKRQPIKAPVKPPPVGPKIYAAPKAPKAPIFQPQRSYGPPKASFIKKESK